MRVDNTQASLFEIGMRRLLNMTDASLGAALKRELASPHFRSLMRQAASSLAQAPKF